MENRGLVKSQAKLIDIFMLVVSGILVFTLGLHGQELIGSEIHHAFAAQQFFNYIPVPGLGAIHNWFAYYLIYLSSLPVGFVTEVTAVLPSALATVISLVFVYLSAALYSRRWACYTMVLLFMLPSFIQFARAVGSAQYILLLNSLVLYITLRYCRYYSIKSMNNYLSGHLLLGMLALVLAGFQEVLLPFIPIIALLVSRYWLQPARYAITRYSKYLICFLLFCLPIILSVILWRAKQQLGLQPEIFTWLDDRIDFILIILFALFILQLAYLFASSQFKLVIFRYDFFLFLAVALQVVLMQIFLVQAMQDYAHRTHEFVAETEALRMQLDKNQPIYFYASANNKLSNNNQLYNIPLLGKKIRSINIYRINQLLTLAPNSIIVLDSADYANLPESVREQTAIMVDQHFGTSEALALQVIEKNEKS